MDGDGGDSSDSSSEDEDSEDSGSEDSEGALDMVSELRYGSKILIDIEIQWYNGERENSFEYTGSSTIAWYTKSIGQTNN